MDFFIPTIILNTLIIIISLYLFFLFIKSKSFHTYPCYNIIIFSFIILLDNILRVIPSKLTVLNYIQAFILVLLDKLILATLSCQVLIFYFGVIKTKFYFAHEKAIFFTTFIVNTLICLILTIIFIALSDNHIRKPTGREYYYCDKLSYKIYIDTVFNALYLIISVYCSIVLLVFISNKKKEAAKGKIEDLDYHRNFIRALVLFFLITITFVESYLIIYDVIHGLVTEILYLGICFLIDLFNSFNKTILKESMRIFCQKTDEIQQEGTMKIDNDDDNTDEDGAEIERVRTESF